MSKVHKDKAKELVSSMINAGTVEEKMGYSEEDMRNAIHFAIQVGVDSLEAKEGLKRIQYWKDKEDQIMMHFNGLNKT